jgi:hypothetical protein
LSQRGSAGQPSPTIKSEGITSEVPASWNQITLWLRRLDGLRSAAWGFKLVLR